MSDSDSDQQRRGGAAERLEQAYERMLERVHAFGERTEQRTLPLVRDALMDAREKAVELGELTREEAERVAGYLERDVKDAADFIVETGQDFRDWFQFDWQLINARLFEMFAEVADQTSLGLRQLAEQARAASQYRTGELTGPGTLVCVACGEELHFKKAGHIPPCPKCQATAFRRPGADEEPDNG